MSELATTENNNNVVASTSTSDSGVPARSLNRQAVLDEDEYTEALSHIIARDFFPSLVHLDAANSYLDALRSEDPSLINASVRQLQELQTPSVTGRRGRQPFLTPSQTPYAAGPTDTPYTLSRHTSATPSEPPSKRARLDTTLSLDVFQARYTSEDNASFTQILDDENRVRREKYGWAWEAQRRVEEQRGRMVEARERLLIEPFKVTGVRERLVVEPPEPPRGLLMDGREQEKEGEGEEREKEDEEEEEEEEEEDGEEANGTENEKGNGGKATKALAVVKKAEEEEGREVDVMAPKKDTRPAGVDGWKFKTRNAFMFPPDADIAPYNASTAASALPTRGESKSIKYTNTRLPEQSEGPSRLGSVSEPPSPTRSRIDAAIMGTPYRPSSPRNNGFSLLPSLPSPTPEQLGPNAVKQLMTWGTLGATPRILSSSVLDDPADLPESNTPFRISAPTAREAIGHRLSNSAAKSLRVKASMMNSGGTGLGIRTPGRTHMPPPSWTPGGLTPRKADAVGALAPAARRLLDRTTSSVAGARRADAMGKTAGWTSSSGASKTREEKERDLNRVRWTPSPAPVSRRR